MVFKCFILSVLLLQPLSICSELIQDNKPQFSENVIEVGVTQSLELVSRSPLFSKKSKYQDVHVYLSKHFGKVLVIDEAVQLTEKDADSYNEMMAHVPLFEHNNPKNVLIIGGGDGFILNEVRLKNMNV